MPSEENPLLPRLRMTLLKLSHERAMPDDKLPTKRKAAEHKRGSENGADHSTRTRSATAGESELCSQWSCGSHVERGTGVASVHRLV